MPHWDRDFVCADLSITLYLQTPLAWFTSWGTLYPGLLNVVWELALSGLYTWIKGTLS